MTKRVKSLKRDQIDTKSYTSRVKSCIISVQVESNRAQIPLSLCNLTARAFLITFVCTKINTAKNGVLEKIYLRIEKQVKIRSI